jgi:hypothetical protein
VDHPDNAGGVAGIGGQARRTYAVDVSDARDAERRLAETQQVLRDALAPKTVPMLPHPFDVPWAEAKTVDDSEGLFPNGPRCGAKAQFSSMFSAVYGGGTNVASFQLVSCARPKGHEGAHFARGDRLPFRHRHHAWKWEQAAPPELPHPEW